MTDICPGCESVESVLSDLIKIGIGYEPTVCVRCYNEKGEISYECLY